MRNKGLKIALASVVGVSLLSTGASVMYLHNCYEKGLIKYTVNGKTVGCPTTEYLEQYLIDEQALKLDGLDITEAIDVEVDMYNIDNMRFIDYLGYVMFDGDVRAKVEVSGLDKDKLRDILTEYNKDKVKSEDAYISVVEGKEEYEVIPEKLGTMVDIDRLISDISDGSDSVEDISNISLNDYFMLPDIVSADLQEVVDDANNHLNWAVDYDSGDSFKASLDDVKIVNNKVELNTDFITGIIRQLEKYYDNIGGDTPVTLHTGEQRVVTGGTWGTMMSSPKEKEALIEMFKNAKWESNRRPIMKYDKTEVGNTYIEVSLAEQHLWLVENGQVVSETPVTTGKPAQGTPTRVGVYFITEKIPGKYLKGDDYKVWVDRWMRLTTSGLGLHDAKWRSTFGGTYYLSSGSHGCVNMPAAYAYDLYEHAYVNMPVIIY